jgi:hypothetical protein
LHGCGFDEFSSGNVHLLAPFVCIWLEAVSEFWIRFEGQAQSVAKAQHTRYYVSILRWSDELLNIHKNRCEIPLWRDNAAIGPETGF